MLFDFLLPGGPAKALLEGNLQINRSSAEQEMKVFIAGATGAIGQPLISRLVVAGHDVVGMTSFRAWPANLERSRR